MPDVHDDTTAISFQASEEITTSAGSMPVHSEEITLISENPTTDPRGRPASELLDTHSERVTALRNLQTSVGFTQPMPIADSLRGTGLCVVMLEANEAQRGPLYPLEFGEPLDVDGPAMNSPATFTATPHGLRLDSLGGLRGVYIRLDQHTHRTPWRKLRKERQLGTFQALAPGEHIPPGALALFDDTLIRIDPL